MLGNPTTNKKWLFLACIVSLVSVVSMALDGFKTEYKLFKKTCTACHECSWFLWPRSFKAWQLTVERMRSHAEGAEPFMFTKEEGDRIARFLADHIGDGVLLTSAGQEVFPGETDVDALVEVEAAVPTSDVAQVEAAVSTSDVAQVEAAVSTTEGVQVAAAVATSDVVRVAAAASEPAATEAASEPMVRVSPHVVVPASIAARAKRFWNPSAQYLALARVTGFYSVAFLVGLFGSGLGRRKLKLRFRKVHVAMALGLFLSLTVHGIIYICKYGTPSVLWYWFGLVGFIALIVTQVQGIIRKHFRRGLLVAHIAGACLGLALSILHWIWAWL